LPIPIPIFTNTLVDTFFTMNPYVKGIDNEVEDNSMEKINNYFEKYSEQDIKQTAKNLILKLIKCLKLGFNPMIDGNFLSLWNVKNRY